MLFSPRFSVKARRSLFSKESSARDTAPKRHSFLFQNTKRLVCTSEFSVHKSRCAPRSVVLFPKHVSLAGKHDAAAAGRPAPLPGAASAQAALPRTHCWLRAAWEEPAPRTRVSRLFLVCWNNPRSSVRNCSSYRLYIGIKHVKHL